MKTFKKVLSVAMGVMVVSFLLSTASKAQGQDYSGQEDPNKKVLKNALLGAGTGAIAASASGGKAGKGALIGAGTNVIGSALLDSLSGPSQPQQPQYVQQAPQYVQQAPQYVQQSSSYPVQPVQTQYVQEPVYVQQQSYYPPQEDPNKKIIKSGLLGAGTGAIAASASGGNAGKGALIGAGTNVIGGALLDSLTSGPSQPQYAQSPQYVQSAPQYVQQSSSYPVQTVQTQYSQEPVYVQQQPSYYQPQEDPNKKIIKSGLLGAGVGAISASASGGSAGKGALIGAGTNIIGGALLDSLTGPSQPKPQPVYYQQQQPTYYQNQQYQSSSQPKKKIIRKYDSDGNVVSEEEVWE